VRRGAAAVPGFDVFVGPGVTAHDPSRLCFKRLRILFLSASHSIMARIISRLISFITMSLTRSRIT
jgi:hypothetical protein